MSDYVETWVSQKMTFARPKMDYLRLSNERNMSQNNILSDYISWYKKACLPHTTFDTEILCVETIFIAKCGASSETESHSAQSCDRSQS
jgi:hypothetical protein